MHKTWRCNLAPDFFELSFQIVYRWINAYVTPILHPAAAEQYNNYEALYEQQSAANKELQLTVATLTRQLDQLKKMIFDSKTERFVPAAADTTASAQLSLALIPIR